MKDDYGWFAMMRLLSLVIIAPALLAAGCATSNPAADWREQTGALSAQYRQAIEQDRTLDVIRPKMSLLGVKDQTFAMLADRTTPTPDEQIAIRRYAEFREQHLRRVTEVDVRFSAPGWEIEQRSRTAIAGLLADLYSGRLTYGDFAARRQQVADATATAQQQRNQQMASRAAADREQQSIRDQQMTAIGAALLIQGMPKPAPAPSYGGIARGAAFFKRSYISGMNQICIYDRLGSEVAVTIGMAEMCPLNLN